MKDADVPGVGGSGTSDLASKIDYLFRTVYPAGRGPYSYKEAAEGIAKAGGGAVSDTTLWKLRTGKSDNPTKRVLEGLAVFFGVEPAYFFDNETTEAVGAEVELLVLLRDAGVNGAQLRSFVELSPESREMVTQLIANTAKLERQRHRRSRPTDGDDVK
ncbi:MAG: family transcriptional regulator [Actinomycetia bacterium]|nr:family transcriptional regulator [Actinomycetes bacterium]